MWLMYFAIIFLIHYTTMCNLSNSDISTIEYLVKKWAPRIWLAPDEQFFPLSVSEFLNHVTAVSQFARSDSLPIGYESKSWYLITKDKLDNLLENTTSFLYGKNPRDNPIPIYALIDVCKVFKRNIHFHVTYWFFYPFSEGKRICTLNLGRLGPIPIPMIFNKCLGAFVNFGSHVGDWEHVSLYFDNIKKPPKQIYVSTHDSGVYYNFDNHEHVFAYEKQETRRGILQKPQFPLFVHLDERDQRPVLFSAKGSHGFWSAPGTHKFARVPRLYDLNGFGTEWPTWKFIEMVYFQNKTVPYWMHFLGKWGNPKDFCHPLHIFGINICQRSDGPTGILMKKPNFKCDILK